MAINSLPDTLKSTKWSKDPGKSAAAPVTTSLKTFEAAHAAVDWKAAEVGKPTTAAQVDTLKKKIEAAQKQLDKADAEAKKVAAAAGKLANDKEAGKDAKAAQTAAAAFSKGAESFFSAALKELDEATKAIAKAAGKQIPNAGKDASAGAPVNKADDQLLVKLCKKAIQSAMKPKPGAPSMQFAIIGKQGTPLRVLMGTKTEIAKLIGKFGKVDPKTKKKPPIAKDPKSRLLFENGALVFETAKIPAGFMGGVKRALVKQIKKGPKIKWRKPGLPDVEDDSPSEALTDADVAVQQDKASAAELAEFKKAYDDARKRVTSADGQKALLAKAKEAKDEIGGDLKEAAAAAAKGDFESAADLMAGIETALDEAPEDDAPPSADELVAEMADQTEEEDRNEKIDPKAKAAGLAAAAANVTPQMKDAIAAWNTTKAKATRQVDDLINSIKTSFPPGTENLEEAMVTMAKVRSVMSGKVIDGALLKMIKSKSKADLDSGMQNVQASIAMMQKVIATHPVVKELDNNEVFPIKAAQSVNAGLETLKKSLTAR